MSRKQPAPVGPAPRLLRIAEAAKYLGTTPWQIRSLIWSRTISRVRLGRRDLIDIHDLDKLVEQRKAAA